jgi:GH25 family lysozyme M1 (1,4-beta-N-acetylmuramidase)
MSLRAIDISMHQPSIDLASVDADVVIMKATEGVGYTDPQFARHYAAAIAANRPVGFYHFATAKLTGGSAAADARAEAAAFVTAVAGRAGVVALDWEADVVRLGPSWAQTWLDTVRAATGRTPFIYMSESVTSAYDWAAVAATYPLWVANYGTNKQQGWSDAAVRSPRYWGAAKTLIWQYTSAGRISGYSGNLDLNRVYLTREQWAGYAGGAAPTPPPSPPISTPPAFPLPAGYVYGPKSGGDKVVSGLVARKDGLTGAGLRTWQQRMSDRGWAIDPDGKYGDETARVTRAFQKEKSLTVDGLIGPATWAAAWTAPIT